MYSETLQADDLANDIGQANGPDSNGRQRDSSELFGHICEIGSFG